MRFCFLRNESRGIRGLWETCAMILMIHGRRTPHRQKEHLQSVCISLGGGAMRNFGPRGPAQPLEKARFGQGNQRKSKLISAIFRGATASDHGETRSRRAVAQHIYNVSITPRGGARAARGSLLQFAVPIE